MESDKQYILQLGNDQLTPKATYYPSALAEYGLETIYLTEDRSGLSQSTITNEDLEAKILSSVWIVRYVQVLISIFKYNPIAFELYLSQRPWFILYYFFLAKLFQRKLIVWCRGELRNFRKHHWLRRFANRVVLKNANYILLRETYMEDILKAEKIYDAKKTYLFHNCIPLTKPIVEAAKNSDIVFLNSFKSFRNIDLIIEAAKILKESNYSFRMRLVGSTLDVNGYSPSSVEYELMLRRMVEKYGLSEFVHFFPFSDNVEQHLKSARMFVLPADIVFCNYTLLESMSMCIPPIVSNIPESSLIIEDNIDGLLVDRNPVALAAAMKKLIDNPDLASTLGQCSRNKIIQKFNIETKVQSLARFYKS